MLKGKKAANFRTLSHYCLNAKNKATVPKFYTVRYLGMLELKLAQHKLDYFKLFQFYIRVVLVGYILLVKSNLRNISCKNSSITCNSVDENENDSCERLKSCQITPKKVKRPYKKEKITKIKRNKFALLKAAECSYV